VTAMCSPYEVTLSEMPLLRSLAGRGRRPNMLVVCSDPDVPSAFERVRDLLGPPFSVCVLPGPLELPASEEGTLFLHDIGALTLPQQIRLYDWLSARGRGVQVVSMTGSRLLPLVETGRFHEGLFYRLNTISLVARSA
jgi:Sigma-54 interaction domain